MHFKSVLILIVMFLASMAVRAADTLTYRYNVRAFPVLEGGQFGLEYSLGQLKNGHHAVKGLYTYRKNDDFSIFNGLNNYRENSIRLQYRYYLSRQPKNMSGLFQGLQLNISQTKGNGELFIPDRMTFITTDIEAKSLSFGYVLGYQKMTNSGFNFDIGYTMSYQLKSGDDYDALWLDEIQYKPYTSGVVSRVFAGVGLAF